MAGINFIGSYSGIDQGMIDQLMQVEKLPLNQLARQKNDITAKQNAWKDVNTRLNSLFEKLKTLQNPGTLTSMTTKSSNESIVSMIASKDAVAGRYDIHVEKLATNTRMIFDGINIDSNGTFLIKNVDGEVSEAISVTAGEDLASVASKINKASEKIGINSTVIDGKLVVSDLKTGERGIRFIEERTTENPDDDKSFVSFGFRDSTSNELGEKAIFNINGINGITSDSNIVKDTVLGLTINLNQVGESTVTVSTDNEKLTKAVQDFVDQYNSTMGFIEEQIAAGTVTDSGTTGRGTLAGDSSLQSLHSALRRMVTESLGGNDGTTINDISVLGVSTTDKSGRLSFNSSKLLEEFTKDPQNVMSFFSHENKDTDSNNINVGFIAKLNTKIDSYISSKDGLIKNKNDSFERTLKDLNKQIDRFNDRMIRKEQYYTKMFAALDVAMMQAESQMEWLNGQISAMNAQTAANKK